VPTGKTGIETVPLTVRLRVLSSTVSAKDSVTRAKDVECIDLSRGGDKWRALVQAATNCRVPHSAGCGTPEFSRTLTHGVSA
jgi:hypothetical protein